jgi:uncharacterized protein
MLTRVISRLRSFRGLARKSNLQEILDIFGETSHDDAGLIAIGDLNIVASVDSIIENLVTEEPRQAGYYSILVSINDVVAKGARPLAYLNSISSESSTIRREIAEGIKSAADNFGLRLLKGHTNPDASYNAVESTVIGVAKNFIPDSGAEVGDYLIAVIDLNGVLKENGWLKIFDSSSETKLQIANRLSILLRAADEKWVNSAKDISGAGIVGTIAMLSESSKVGANIDLEKIPRPKMVPLEDWLLTFPSFGFIFTTKRAEECLEIFRRGNLAAEIIGLITEDKKISVTSNGERGVFLDLEKESVYCQNYPAE